MRCQCSHDQHDTQPNERPHCTFVAGVVGAAAALGAIDEHVLLSGAARHGRAHMHMTVVVVFVILHLADLTLATLPDGRLGAAPTHASPSAQPASCLRVVLAPSVLPAYSAKRPVHLPPDR